MESIALFKKNEITARLYFFHMTLSKWVFILDCPIAWHLAQVGLIKEFIFGSVDAKIIF